MEGIKVTILDYIGNDSIPVIYDPLQDIVLLLLNCYVLFKIPSYFLPTISSGTQYLLRFIFHMANMLGTNIVIENHLKRNPTITVLIIRFAVIPSLGLLKYRTQLVSYSCTITHVVICEWAKILMIRASNLCTLNYWSARNHIFINCEILAPNGSTHWVLSC